jgi:hypothetical protein
MTKAQTIHANEIKSGNEMIARFSSPEHSHKPGAKRIPEIQERIAYLESMTDEQIEKMVNFLPSSVTLEMNFKTLQQYNK